MELFDCQGLRARISPAQCRANRTRPVSSSLLNLPTRPPACFSCRQWLEFDPPENVTDPAELALAETLADLWSDIEEGRLGVKYILTSYNQRVPLELRKRRSLLMGDWLQMLGFRVLSGEAFKGVHGRRCLLVDGSVEAFVRERGGHFLRAPEGQAAVHRLLQVVGLEPAVSGPKEAEVSAVPKEATPPARVHEGGPEETRITPDGAPCVCCRYFRPMPTFDDGVEGMRLCWSRRPAWDFSCFANREEVRHEACAGL